jgi:hypothetical protein
MDIVAVSEAVALMAATGAVSGLSEHAAVDMAARIRNKIRAVFNGDARSLDSLTRAVEDPTDQNRIRELAAAMAWYAQRDHLFANEMTTGTQEFSPTWSVSQKIRAGQDAYTAGRDMTVNQSSEDQ